MKKCVKCKNNNANYYLKIKNENFITCQENMFKNNFKLCNICENNFKNLIEFNKSLKNSKIGQFINNENYLFACEECLNKVKVNKNRFIYYKDGVEWIDYKLI